HRPPTPTLFPYTTLFRSHETPLEHWINVGNLRRALRQAGVSVTIPDAHVAQCALDRAPSCLRATPSSLASPRTRAFAFDARHPRSEEHTSELQSQSNLVC